MADFIQHKFTVADYYIIGRAGVLPESAQVELINGIVYDEAPMGPFHAIVCSLLSRDFILAQKKKCSTRVRSPIHFGDYTEFQADLALVKRGEYMNAHPTPREVFLAVEVADTSLTFDQQIKLPIYARAGIPEFWIVNLPQLRIDVYSDPFEDRYRSLKKVPKGILAPRAFPAMPIDVTKLLRKS